MPHKKILRILILAEIILGLLSSATRAFEAEIVAPPGADLEFDGAWSPIGAFLGILCFGALIIGWIGLWKLWRPARMIYTLSWVFGPAVVYLALRIWNVQTPTEAFFGEFVGVAAGMILGLTYFSDLAKHFTKMNAEQVGAPNPATRCESELEDG